MRTRKLALERRLVNLGWNDPRGDDACLRKQRFAARALARENERWLFPVSGNDR